ncbi:MAG: pyruvate dehydrogenase complex dihydrolipoamide acetyltransferase, partial [Longimicrobiales bacterium]
MATKVHMEALSPTMEEGQVVKWLKSEGDSVVSGEVLAEIETDKATMELVARGDGLLRKILVGEGGTAPVGDVIAVIASAEEDVSEFEGGSAGASAVPPPAPEATEATEATEVEAAAPAAEAAETLAAPEVDRAANGRIKASPVARRLAAEAGLDLASVAGSGPGGRIVKQDVEAALEGGVPTATAPARPPAPTPAVPPASDADYEDVPLTQMRKTIARRLVESIGPVPHFFLTVDVDMTRALEARQRINAMLEAEGRKTSINDLIIRATAAALRRHPDCNAHWMGDSVRRFNRVHIGVAVAIDDGLITPVIRDAHMKGVADIGAEVRELAGRAREKKLMPDEYTGATFSISNLGMLGIHEFTAVINPPEAGILAVGGVEDTPVVVDGEIRVRPRMRITMSCDHRVIDGALGARFLATLRGMLEEPAT